jgi:hypothetical protein
LWNVVLNKRRRERVWGKFGRELMSFSMQENLNEMKISGNEIAVEILIL